MAKKEENMEVDSLGIPIKHYAADEESSIVEEAEFIAKNHVSIVLGIFFFVIMIITLIVSIKKIVVPDILGGLMAMIFIMWTAFLSDTFEYYKYISMTVMFLIYMLYMFIRII